MSTYSWLVTGLSAFDLGICLLLYLIVRASADLNRSVLLPVGAGMIGFAAHALMFFDGAFLAVQLSTLAVLFGIVLWEVRKRRPAPY
jgi:hypothetical protein